MATAERTRDRGHRQAQRLLGELGTELRDARLGAGISQRHVATVAGLSQATVSRVENARSMATPIDDLASHCAALGLWPSVKVYPDGPAVRDAGQLRLLQRLRALVYPRFRWQSEVPIGRCGDLRAWDVRLDGPGSIGIDDETRLHDI